MDVPFDHHHFHFIAATWASNNTDDDDDQDDVMCILKQEVCSDNHIGNPLRLQIRPSSIYLHSTSKASQSIVRFRVWAIDSPDHRYQYYPQQARHHGEFLEREISILTLPLLATAYYYPLEKASFVGLPSGRVRQI
jgi:hypothetical protein